MFLPVCQLPERIFNDSRRVHADSQFQKHQPLVPILSYKTGISGTGALPRLILNEVSVAPQIDLHITTADRTFRHQLRRYSQIFLPGHHGSYFLLVLVQLLMAGLCTLKHTVIALSRKDPFFRKSRQLKLMIHVRCQNKVIPVFHQLIQIQIGLSSLNIVAVTINMPAPVRPFFLLCGKRVKTGRIHICHTVVLDKITEFLPEAPACIR